MNSHPQYLSNFSPHYNYNLFWIEQKIFLNKKQLYLKLYFTIILEMSNFDTMGGYPECTPYHFLTILKQIHSKLLSLHFLEFLLTFSA